MQITNYPEYLVVDVKDVIDRYVQIPSHIRSPSSVMSDELDQDEMIDMEIEGLVSLLDVKHMHMDAVYEYCSEYVNGFKEDRDDPDQDLPEPIVKDLHNYVVCLSEFASDLSQHLNDHGFYDQSGYLKGEFCKMHNGHLLILKSEMVTEE